MSVATFTVHLASADCASEAQSLERVLHGAPGVRSVYVNPVTSRATVTADPDVLDAAKLTDRETLLAPGSIRMKGSTNTVTAAKMLDPVCDMIVDLAEARDQGLTLELPDREYAFCGQGCQTKFAKSPETYRPKVDAWLAAESRDGHFEAHAHADASPVMDAGMREWHKACRCCMHDAYPAVVEQLDAERAPMAQAPSDAGICETAEAQQSGPQ